MHRICYLQIRYCMLGDKLRTYKSVFLPVDISRCDHLSYTQASNLDEEVSRTPCNFSYIAVVQMDGAMDLFIVVEREVVCKVKSVLLAVKMLMASYYVFNISYPKCLGGFCIFK